MSNDDKRQEEAMNCGLNIDERDLLQRRLRALPETMPPRAVWQRVEQQARAEGLFTARIPERTRWLAGAGVAAAVVLAVLNLPVTPGGGPDVDSDRQAGVTVPSYEDVAANDAELRGLNALMVESQRIERNLRALPAQPSVVRASTAATISELQDQITAIDFVLTHPDLGLSAEQEETYWRERVRLMNSLLALRTAQAQRMSF